MGFILSVSAFCVAALARAIASPRGVLPWPPPPGMVLAVGTSLAFLAGWRTCRGRRLPSRALDAVDAGLVLVVCAVPSLVLLRADLHAPGFAYTMLLVVTNVLVARSLYVPSRSRRTLWIGVAAVVPSLLAASLYARSAASVSAPGTRFFVVEAAVWFVAAVATSTLASSLIFGLRQKARAAWSLGQYTLEEKIGEGGMGVVYRARHGMLRRPTAVKLLRAERAGEQSLRRFEREVQLTAALSHPNTVSIYDYGRTHDGVFYYAMEYLDGVDLEQLVREFGPQPPARVAHVLRQVAEALVEAHGVGLIHRDIKPANVILCRRGGVPDVAKVVDFGLVRELASASDASLSGLGTIAGTPLYLSPESITRPESVDGRSDLYALGAVAYFLLAGHNVFTGATMVEVCSHHLHSRPEPPSGRLGRPLPAKLEALVEACLEKDPARRPQSALELAQALRDCDAGEWAEAEAREWWDRHGELLGAIREGSPRTGRSAPELPTLSIDLWQSPPPLRDRSSLRRASGALTSGVAPRDGGRSTGRPLRRPHPRASHPRADRHEGARTRAAGRERPASGEAGASVQDLTPRRRRRFGRGTRPVRPRRGRRRAGAGPRRIPRGQRRRGGRTSSTRRGRGAPRSRSAGHARRGSPAPPGPGDAGAGARGPSPSSRPPCTHG